MGIMPNPQLSKEVGWDKEAIPFRFLRWPQSFEEVEAATDYQILVWHRFLSSPENDSQIELMNHIQLRIGNAAVEDELGGEGE